MTCDVLQIVRSIPEGRVTTYGSIARFLHISPRNVAFVLAGSKGKDIPWHRVVSAQGWLNRDRKMGDRKQERRLRKEGISVKDQQVDLDRYGVEAKTLNSGVHGGQIYKKPQ